MSSRLLSPVGLFRRCCQLYGRSSAPPALFRRPQSPKKATEGVRVQWELEDLTDIREVVIRSQAVYIVDRNR